jgi:hypothetical protein
VERGQARHRHIVVTTLRAVRTATAAVLLLLLAACAGTGAADDAADGGPGGGSGPDAGIADLGPDELVLRVEHTGGFVTPAMLASRLPIISVYGDGRVITEGPTTLSYPPPALPNLLERRIGAAGVRTLVDRARAAGVGGPEVDYGQPPIADAPATRFTVLTDVVEVYALSETPDDGHGLTAEQVRARAKLRALLSALTDLQATLDASGGAAGKAGEERPYRAAAVAAVASPWSADQSVPEPPEAAWPGPTLPGKATGPDIGCVTATGADADAVLSAAGKATAITPWRSGGKRWTIALRPLLPDETDCADLS